MNIGTSFQIAGVSSVTSTRSATASRTAQASRRADLVALHLETNRLQTSISRIREGLVELEKSVGTGRRIHITSDAIDLTSDQEYTTLTSTEELNTVSTSYGPLEPSWAGGSTSQATVGGEYDGRYGDDTLLFRVRRDRTVGGNKTIRMDIYTTSDGKKVDSVSWGAWTPEDTPKTLKSGLTVSLGAGDVDKNDEIEVDVFSSIGTDVDPDEAFSEAAAWLQSPIVDGAFEIDGISVDVYASDSLNDVIARIEANVAHLDVTLQDDALTFTRTTADDTDIVVGSDTSGFLDAMKLTSAVADLGHEGTGTGETPIGDVEDLASVTTGTLTVNGVEIGIDVTSDSLNDVVAAINTGVEGVEASLDEDNGTISLRTRGNVRNLTLEDDTGLLSAFGVAEGLYRGGSGSTLASGRRRDAADLMLELELALEAWNTAGGDDTGSLKSALAEGIALHTDDAGWVDLGLTFDFDDDAPLAIDRGALDRLLRSDPDVFFEQLLGGDSGGGMLETMEAVLAATAQALAAEHGATGLLVSVAA